MHITSDELDRAILEELDYGWVDDRTLILSDDELDSLSHYFELGGQHSHDQLSQSLRRVFQSFVTQASAERPNDRATGSRMSKPSTVAISEIQELVALVEKLERKLDKLKPETLAAIHYIYERLGILGTDGTPIRAIDLKANTLKILDVWIGALGRDIIETKRGPNNVAMTDLVRSLANLWALFTGDLPKHNKERGASDPFLELCQKFLECARLRVKKRAADVSNTALSGIVNDVLKDLRRGRN